jgi:hypothetical protein
MNTETHDEKLHAPKPARARRSSKRPAPPVDLGFIPAKKLIGQTILILGISNWADHYGRRMVSARFQDGRSFYFPSGIAVEQQLLREKMSFPVWTKLTWQESDNEHGGFYLLEVASTISIEKIKQHRKKPKNGKNHKCKPTYKKDAPQPQGDGAGDQSTAV